MGLLKIKRYIILIALLAVLMNNSIQGQVIKLDAIYVNLTYEVKNVDTLYYPYTIGYAMSIHNDLDLHLIFGAYHCYSKGKYKNGVFRVNINEQIFDLTNRREQLFLVLSGDTLEVISELHNKIFLSMAFKKEDLEVFKQSLQNIKISYYPVVKDYPANIVETYFIRKKYDIIIDNPDIIISNRHILRE